MAFPNAKNQYLKTQVETASKEQLVVMLFDGIIRFTEQARKAIEEKNPTDSHQALMRAQAIIMELICTIDKEKGGEVAKGMMSLHAYAFNALIVCNLKKDVSKIDEVQNIYRELREAWVAAMDSLGIGASKAATAAAAAAAPAAKTAVPAKPAIPHKPLPAAAPAGMMTLAAGKTQVSAPVPAPTTPAPAAPAPAPAMATGYGMGRTAAFGAPVRPAVAAGGVRPTGVQNAYAAGARSLA